MDANGRDHLEHLPGRGFLLALTAISAFVTFGAAFQLAAAEGTGSVLWGVTIAIGALTLLALGVAWEERRAHVHALVREALEEKGPVAADSIAELMRMGAHREVDYLRTRVEGPAREELS